MDYVVATLVFIRQDDRVLLGMKKRGLGEGRWNGFGGKVGENEAIEAAAIRETEEECGVVVTKLEQRGLIDFSWPSNKHRPLRGHIFEAIEWEGEPLETEEMKPQWFKVSELPYKSMWADDELWLPLFLENRRFYANFSFNEDDSVKEYSIKEGDFSP